MDMCPLPPPRRHRSLFLSDLHLGSRGCRAERILAFLRDHTAPDIYLVGDILDLWHPPFPHWTASHDAILALLLRRVQEGARLHYLTGNHDAAMRVYLGQHFQRITVAEEILHEAADGRRYLVIHGDVCDPRLLRFHMMTRLGSRLDWMLRHLDERLKRMRRTADPDRRSLIEALLKGVDAAMAFGTAYEQRLVARARRAGCDGVICGHFHKAALHEAHGLVYANCGDWVDSFTALAEDDAGRLSLIEASAAPEPADAFARAFPIPAEA
ncbi:UDP-2,3-diacylglucosamine diphosphatase [Cereibacter azotoformans]|uniref:UDP-2,3-diacylglucosamine pyrophosphatase LpxH n=1 Tax=Cereibacter azotoformans TaxID=43057 RepID=A0A2T5K6L2_9RHOB|nr:UDP-2,3-diacylglucosamine diphosphatase [Cereibacter azotoformans]AXQ92949.1 UDP-2,3-diacylglucosamine diphosphatase [Cereibacter sphaeroides]MBO4169373.1 UDP-2,3-diacylglucosamine diphosphatase [Cereibacter azotoformans]PTR18050.1 UDP-2,3-diacylglucosamine pyrophosphatase LpxH [Cereibacter azotoformans]UIJ31241.1 UDP-2,3-diacylglucosamine diphosphatase [Cereibacter azotoformans]